MGADKTLRDRLDDLKEASSCRRVASPDYNYEFAFEVVAPKRTWILCPDDQHLMQAWMAATDPDASPQPEPRPEVQALSPSA